MLDESNEIRRKKNKKKSSYHTSFSYLLSYFNKLSFKTLKIKLLHNFDSLIKPNNIFIEYSDTEEEEIQEVFHENEINDSPTDFSQFDAFLFLLCIFLGILSRTFTTDLPNSCTFDETHFGNFTNRYIRQEYFVDIHPPLAKLYLGLFSRLQSYNATTNFTSDYNEINYVLLRFGITSFSSFVPSLAYLSCRFLGIPLGTSLLGAFLLLCDNSIAAEGKIILTDGILHAVSMIAVCSTCYLAVDDSIVALVICGLSVGCACSIKYTAGGLLALPAFQQFFNLTGGSLIELFRLPAEKDKDNASNTEKTKFEILFSRILATKFAILLGRGFIIGLCALSVLIFSFTVHVIVCRFKSYSEDGFNRDYERSLLWHWETQDQSRFVQMGLFKRVWVSFISMHKINNQCTKLGGFESKWYEWPLVRFNSLIFPKNSREIVWPLPNPFTYYFSVTGIVLCLILPIFNLKNISLISWTITYSASLFPFILVPRTTYQYHYAVPLMIGVIGFCFAISTVPMRKSHMNAMCFTLCIIVLCFGIFYFPVLHSLPNGIYHLRAWKQSLRKIYNQNTILKSENYRLVHA